MKKHKLNLENNTIFTFYTSEDLKRHTKVGLVSNHYWDLTLNELKCPILILQGFK